MSEEQIENFEIVENQVEIKDSKKKKLSKPIVILFIFLIIGGLVYISPDDVYLPPKNTEDAIEAGRFFAHNLLMSREDNLLKMEISGDPATTKLKNSITYHAPIIWGVDIASLREKGISNDIIFPAYTNENREDMELVMLEKFHSFIVTTFAYKSSGEIVEIPNEGKMFFTVSIIYTEPPLDNRILPKLKRKIINIPSMFDLTQGVGQTGEWLIFDYDHKYNMNNYRSWVLEGGENYSKIRQGETTEFLEQMRNDENFGSNFLEELREKSSERTTMMLVWIEMATERQIDYIEKLYETTKEIE